MTQANQGVSPLERIKKAADIFKTFGMPDSEKMTLKIIEYGKNKSPDRTLINETFKTLQTLTKAEYSTIDNHKARCIDHVYKITRMALGLNIKTVVQTMNAMELVDNVVDRMNASITSRTLTKVLMKGSQNDEERLTSLSVAYAHDIEGVYKRCLRDCYTWDRLAKKKIVQPEKIPRMDIADILNYYKAEGNDLSIFEGYDKTVRNAVGHSSFVFDKEKQRMWYEDRDSGEIKNYSFDELLALHNKTKDVYQTVIINWQVLTINTACLDILGLR